MRPNGFSLLELLVATTLLLAAVAALAGLAVSTVRMNADARAMTDATVLADEKVQELEALPWGDASLAPSPPGSLVATTAGYADYVDALGRELGSGPTAPAGAVYVRRWSIAPVPDASGNALALEVAVTRQTSGGGGPQRDQIHIAAVRVRPPS
jgi:Tfp pilus assembly protein PilV